jgi:O-methyltransferase involved in polyketide biosynthesis
MAEKQKDFSSVSPSAKSLLLMKGYTNIPYAKETAALTQGPEIFDLNFEDKDFWFWIRVMHFENRYWTVDQLLKQTDYKNILELSSGFSFRGLDLCKNHDGIHYIDTDLPEVIATKHDMIDQLQLDKGLKGRFEMLPLNALDEQAFNALVDTFDAGPLAIINEGLLMYLNLEEKKQLCKTIHVILKKRGGCWITADIYPKRTAQEITQMPKSSSEASFMEQHNVEENKFDSFEAAERFFSEQGFELVKEAVPDYQALSSLPYLMKFLPEEVRNSNQPPPKIQATWMLKIADR